MNFAIIEALKAFEAKEVPVGAVIVKDNQILGRGHNRIEALNDPTAHAEIIAITSATNTIKNWRLTNCKLYVTKEPCLMCAGAIVNSRIQFVGFGMYDEKEGCCGSLYQLCSDVRLKHRAAIKGGILDEKCKKIMQDFFNLKRIKKL